MSNSIRNPRDKQTPFLSVILEMVFVLSHAKDLSKRPGFIPKTLPGKRKGCHFGGFNEMVGPYWRSQGLGGVQKWCPKCPRECEGKVLGNFLPVRYGGGVVGVPPTPDVLQCL
jgi:hypothetical protein